LKKQLKKFALISIGVMSASGCSSSCDVKSHTQTISGKVVEGLRIIDLNHLDSMDNDFRVYRGDYVIFLDEGKRQIEIPELEISANANNYVNSKEKIKMTESGDFKFVIGGIEGEIKVIEFSHPEYVEVVSKTAPGLIQNLNPLILDVRTLSEYRSGHLKNAILIPVQELDDRIQELESSKDDAIFVYCRSGNRSTVASKLLIDSGFKRVYNLRDGMNGWIRENHEFVK